MPGLAEAARSRAFEDPVEDLRTRAATGFRTLDDADALGLLLARSLPSGAEAAAAALLRRFGCLRRVLGADLYSLTSIVDTRAALDLQLVDDITCRLVAAEIPARLPVATWSALHAYFKLTMAHLDREAFRVLFLDKRNGLIADEVLNRGTVDHAPVYPREVMRRALELSASALILVHNHPAGDPSPSTADIDMTRQVIEAGRALRIAVHDHVIVGRAEVSSLKALGLI